MGSVAGLFREESKAEQAMQDLRQAGFAEKEIGVATSGPAETKHTGFWSKIGQAFGKHEHTTTQPEELQHSLEASGLSPDQARYFNSSLDDGHILVTVHADGERSGKAREILQRDGGDVGMSARSGIAGGARTAPQGERHLRLVGEILRVHKERVQRGEVRLRKEVVTENQNIEVPVTKEELVIERIPAQGEQAASSELGSGEKEIRVPLSEEQVRVEKKPVVTGEVRVGKRQVEDTQRVSDTVRHEELRAEHEGEIGNEDAIRDLERKQRKDRAA